MSLSIQNLHISAHDKEIVHGISLVVKPGEVHAIMGPNGSGKSTFANTLLGHPKYLVNQGKILLNSKDITDKSPDFRAKLGMFLSMQYAPEIPGVTVAHFLRVASGSVSGKTINPFEFHQHLRSLTDKLSIDPSFATRYLNAGFSGGEKKRTEILQLLVLNPQFAILDETDSGLDVDALKVVGQGINAFRNSNNALVLITHYNRLLEYVTPDFVHIMVKGKIVATGGKELAEEVEKNGYQKYLKTDV